MDGGGGVEELRRALQPPGFGAAYKVLDLLVEHVLRANGASPGRIRRFDQKGALLAKGMPSNLPIPLDRRHDLWDGVAALYPALKGARHGVTHRKAQVRSTGDLQIFDDQRRLTDTVTHGELAAFAAAIHSLAELVIEESQDQRRINIVAWYLNALASRHGQTPASEASDPMAGRGLLRADLGEANEGLTFDVAAARTAIEGQKHGLWDLELLWSGGSIFVGRWEDVPDTNSFAFDPGSPPLRRSRP